jgi:hypothetical protein
LGLVLVPLVAAGCGGSGGAAAAGDPVSVTDAYINAVKGNPDGGQQYLESEPTEKVTGSTSLSRFLGTNKSAKAEIVPINWIPPNGDTPQPSKQQCLIGQPPPAQICIVTVQVTGGKPNPVYFHVVLENRYTGKWEIIDVDTVDGKPENLLPSGNEAHKA